MEERRGGEERPCGPREGPQGIWGGMHVEAGGTAWRHEDGMHTPLQTRSTLTLAPTPRILT